MVDNNNASACACTSHSLSLCFPCLPHTCLTQTHFFKQQEVIEAQIYPPLSNGFTDENAYIRELTLKAILSLAPKMKQGTLTNNVLKHLSRLQVVVVWR